MRITIILIALFLVISPPPYCGAEPISKEKAFKTEQDFVEYLPKIFKNNDVTIVYGDDINNDLLCLDEYIIGMSGGIYSDLPIDENENILKDGFTECDTMYKSTNQNYQFMVYTSCYSQKIEGEINLTSLRVNLIQTYNENHNHWIYNYQVFSKEDKFLFAISIFFYDEEDLFLHEEIFELIYQNLKIVQRSDFFDNQIQ